MKYFYTYKIGLHNEEIFTSLKWYTIINDEKVYEKIDKRTIDLTDEDKLIINEYFASLNVQISGGTLNYSGGTEIIYPWHEENVNIQVRVSYENNINLLESYPELAVYRKTNNIRTYTYASNVFFYVNYFNEGHREILESFGAIITEKIV